MSSSQQNSAFQTTRRSLLAGGAVIGAALLTNGAVSPAFAQTKDGGVLVVSLAGDLPSLDPMVKFTFNSWKVIANLYNGLTRLAEDGSVLPDLAAKWEINENATVWTFHLTPDVKFHDGGLLTSADVTATFAKMMDPKTAASYLAEMGPIEKVEAVDPLTVKFTLKSPFADLHRTLASATAKIISERGITAFDTIGTTCHGTGPFLLSRFVANDRLELTANPAFFRGRPKLDKVIVRILPNVTSQVAALQAKEIDVIGDLSGETAAQLRSLVGVKVREVTGGTFNNLIMLADRPPFNDNRVREALKLTIDREALAGALTNNAGVAANDHPLSAAYEFFNPALPLRKPDIAKAKKLLAEAGFPNGFDHKVVVGTSPPSRQALAVLVQAMAQQAGIRLNIEVMDNPRFLSTVWNKGAESYVGNYATRPTADIILTKLYHDKLGIDEGRWATPTSNKILEDARATTDNARRGELYGQFQKLASEQGPFIISAFFNTLAAHADYVENFPMFRIGLDMPLDAVTLSSKAPRRA